MRIFISAKHTAKILSIVIVTLTALYLVTQYLVYAHDIPAVSVRYELIQRLNMDYEISIPTWYSQMTLFAAAVLLFVIAYAKKQKKGHVLWLTLGGVFAYLSIDEGASLHELLVAPTRYYLDINGGYLYSAWVIPIAVLIVLFIGAYLRLWRTLPRRTKVLTALSASLFVGGAVVMEMVGAQMYTQSGGIMSYTAVLQSTMEESLEMLGVALFIYALLDYMRSMPEKLTPGLTITR
jgi:hypothetical protein